MSLRLCMQCKHFIIPISGSIEDGTCKLFTKLSRITGENVRIQAAIARKHVKMCGYKAKKFEQEEDNLMYE